MQQLKVSTQHHTRRRVWLSRCDHLGDLIITLPIIDQILQYDDLIVIVEEYLIDFAKENFKNIDFLSAPDFLKINSFPLNDIFIPLSMSARVESHAKDCFKGKKLGYFFRTKYWFFSNVFSYIYRNNKRQHESELLRTYASTILPYLKEITLTHINTNWLLKYTVFEKHGLNKIVKIVIHPGSNQSGREWPAQHWAELIKKLTSLNVSLTVTGRVQEAVRFLPTLQKEGCVFENAIGKDLTMTALGHRIANADVVISSGTGPAHLAGAMGVHTVTLYPPMLRSGITRWRPLGSHVNCIDGVYQSGVFCNKGHRCSSSACACMHNISPESVFNKICYILEGRLEYNSRKN